MDTTLACKCDVKKQTEDHVLKICLIHCHPNKASALIKWAKALSAGYWTHAHLSKRAVNII